MITIESLVEQGANVKLEVTLNLWAKRGYLVPVKVGNKNMHAKSDIRRIQTGGKSESVTSYCKKKNG